MKIAARIGVLLLAFAMTGWAGHTRAADSYADLLARARDTRTSDPAVFAETVDALQARRDEATQLQWQEARFLDGFRLAYRGDYAGANTALQALFEEITDPDLKFRVGGFLASTFTADRGVGLLQSYRTLTETLRLISAVKDPDILHQGLLTIAVALNAAGQSAPAAKYARQALQDNHDPRQRCLGQAVIDEANYRLKLVTDDSVLRATIDRCTAINEPLVANYSRLYLARYWNDNGRRDDAIALMSEALPAITAIRYPWLVAEANALLGELYLANGNVDAARGHALAANAALLEGQSGEPRVSAYRTLYQIAKRRGELRSALEYHERFSAEQRANLDTSRARELAYQQAQFEGEEKDRQIAFLDKANEVLRLEQAVERETVRSSRLMAAFLATLLGSLTYWAYRLKRSQIAYRRRLETDPMTRAASRQHFATLAEQALQAAERTGQPVSLVLFDLDHFKSINDLHGHPTGDWVLKTVVTTCREVLPPSCTLGRLGGEEFAILCPGAEIELAQLRADQCRRAIEQIDTAPIGARFPVTASFGVACSSNGGRWFTGLVSQADAMLYQAKRNGRNRVVVPGGIDPMPTPAMQVANGV